jgi:hypothetical protein
MEQLHVLLAWLAAVGSIVLLGAAAITAIGRTRSYLLLDRAILAQLLALAPALATGLAIVPATGGPNDPLHFLYAVLAAVVAPSVRYAARQRTVQIMGRWQVVAGVVTLGAILRLFMTG